MPEPLPADPETEPKYEPLPRTRRRGIGLCLSGGGYRATLFHLGALRRLHELGVLARPDFRTVSSVSGGSIAAAQLATALARQDASMDRAAWIREVEAPLRAFTRRDIRTRALLKRLLPWNWADSTTGVEELARRYEELTALRLAALPSVPSFVFCATDMAYGVGWVFTREAMGSYQAGYQPPPAGFPLARAVAASACFPPVFDPMKMRLDPGALTGGRAPRGPERDACIRGLRLTDGGDYDNMGLEPVWKSHAVVLVSDAGGIFTHEGDKGLLWRIPRYQGIQEAQARALRKRWLIASFATGVLEGAYWGVGSAPSRYGDYEGYGKELARETVAEIRTDLDAFSDAEAGVLMNHGYTLLEAALRAHLPSLLPAPVPPARVPHPEWYPPARTEAELREALVDSGRRALLGRG
jgi:NTE family protein